jgi:two-component system sensor kinase FixL
MQDAASGDRRERANRALRESEALYRATLDSISDAVFLTDDDGRFTFVCPNVDAVFGYSPDEVAAAGRIGALLGENLFDRAELARRREIENIERDVTVKSGQRRTVLVHVKAVSIQGASVLYCCRDVTDLRHAEDEVRELRNELAHVARLALVGQLMASITHEVKQPLTAIVGNAAAAARALGDDTSHPHAAELREILADIATEGRLAADIVDRMKSLSRRRPLAFAPLDLNDLVADTIRFLAGDARRRHVTLSTELEPSLPAVRADRVCIQQVLLGLGLNAMEAMENASSETRRIVVRTRKREAGVELSVSDTGCGIPADALSRVFEPFFTTKAQGLGLGLAIARSIVEAHHGRIWAGNDGRRGATFHIALPSVVS